MTDAPHDPRQRNEDEQPSAESGDQNLPASVIFMELMRKAAAQRHPPPAAPPPPEAEEADFRPLSPAASAPPVPTHKQRALAAARAAEPMLPPAPLTPEEQAREAALEAQRVRRIQRRKERKRQRTVGVAGGCLRTAMIVTLAAGLLATIFTWFTDADYLNREVRSGLQEALATNQSTLPATPLSTPNWMQRIGIVSGHRGPEGDPGAVCMDAAGNALTPSENDINFSVAQIVVRDLRALGFSVDLLDEFDPRLDGYQAAALVSIHANTCREWPGGEIVSGFLIASAAARTGMGGLDPILVDCVAQYYQQAVGLERRFGVTVDMTDYHSFREIHPLTPAAIIELGFMRADWDILTTRAEDMARGITEGVLCFLNPSSTPVPPVAATLPVLPTP
ncbi:MAG: N-acetylmuramoyl-L-alanine amidase [Chloroflexi bacterium]|nr:N-acetylmuramoyl-L-alanine amidase [Chloroflexota bacterium]